MFEQDYLMRLIKEMVRAILKLFFNIDTEAQAAELLENQEQKETLESLLDMVDAGKINEAENRLYDLSGDGDMSALEVALLFYSYLNDQPDEFLEEHGFSREEVRLGMENLADNYGLSSVAKMFLTEL